MIFLTLIEAFEKARLIAPDLTEDDFLEQTRQHLINGQIKATAYDCEIRSHPMREYEWMLIPRVGTSKQRESIPANKWRELKLFIDSDGGGATLYGHDRSPPQCKYDDDLEDWSDPSGQQVYVGIELSAKSINGLWLKPDPSVAKWNFEEVCSWISRELQAGVNLTIHSHGGPECKMLGIHGVTRSLYREAYKNVKPESAPGRPKKVKVPE